MMTSHKKMYGRGRSRTAHKPKKCSGISLIEMLITCVILAIAVLALAKVQTFLIKGTNYAEQQAKAVNLAHAKIEQLRNYTALTGAGDTYTNIASGSENTNSNNTTFALTWTTTNHTTPNYKTVTVQVAWTDQDNKNHNIQLSSIIAEMDPALEGQALLVPIPSNAGNITPE